MTLKKTLLTTAAVLTLSGAAYADASATTDSNVAASSDATATMGDAAVTADADVSADTKMKLKTGSDAEGTSAIATNKVGVAAESEAEMRYNAFAGMSVDDILGMDVESQDGEIVGEIDYVIATDDGYSAVIGIGGFLGLGEYTVALPLEKFEIHDAKLRLNSETEAELEAMPEVDESELKGLDGDFIIS